MEAVLDHQWIYLICSLEEVEECKERGEVMHNFLSSNGNFSG